MSTYITGTSDKSRKKAMKYLLMGGFGFHLFYVGRIKAGIIRFFLGCFGWIYALSAFSGLFDASISFGGRIKAFFMLLIVSAFILVLINIADFIRLETGSFRDNVGAPLRED